jgi:hypothetical protein
LAGAGDQTYRWEAPAVTLLETTLRAVVTFSVLVDADAQKMALNVVSLTVQAEQAEQAAVDVSAAVDIRAECVLAWKGVAVAPGLKMAQVRWLAAVCIRFGWCGGGVWV